MKGLDAAISAIAGAEPIQLTGSVVALRGLTLLVKDLPAPVGSLVVVQTAQGEKLGEVVGFDGGRAIIMLFDHAAGVRSADRVLTLQSSPTVRIGPRLLGRIVDALGHPIDGDKLQMEFANQPVHPKPLRAMERRRITEVLPTGVRAIDLMTTVGRGQRVGIFAGPGVGKSTLLGMIARRTAADVNVIALIGERGREVREFVEDALGEEGLRRSVVIVSTSDESPLMRVRAALAACACAEFFRDQGKDVMLMVDSITRLAHAQRQIGLAVGEPPATKGYTPSVFAMLPSLLERAGAVYGNQEQHHGSITGFYTILVEGDDMTEPISDAVRGILDGHVMLSRKLAHRAHYPAIDVLDSVSRVAPAICAPEHTDSRNMILRLVAAYRDAEDLIQIGAYAAGSSLVTDASIALKSRIDELLQQSVEDQPEFDESVNKLIELARDARTLVDRAPAQRSAPVRKSA